MIPDRQTTFVYFSARLPGHDPGLWLALTARLDAAKVPFDVIHGTKDIWCRDYMPIQIAKNHFVQFRYNPPYLKHDKGKITPGSVVRRFLPGSATCDSSPIVLDGGNVVRWTDKAILTDKFLVEMRKGERRTTLDEIQRLLRVRELIIIPREPYEQYGHADGIVRFVDGGTVVVNRYRGQVYRDRLLGVLRDHGLRCVEIPYLPQKAKRGHGQSAVGVYVNFLPRRSGCCWCRSSGCGRTRLWLTSCGSYSPSGWSRSNAESWLWTAGC